MGNITVIGAQWGDEGKGKIVDWLAENADIIVRFQGGHNAGHTIIIGDKTYKLHALPTGVVRGKPSVIGNGVVVDPLALLGEIETVRKQGLSVTPDNLIISEHATMILPLHGMLDRLSEKFRGKGKIGTTGRGIGPAYEDQVGRRALRMCDLADDEGMKTQLDKMIAHHNALLTGLGEPLLKTEEMITFLDKIKSQILPFVQPVWRVLDEAQNQGKSILFEGAQGAMLDVDHGTYPFVTSSNTVAAQAAIGAGVGPDKLGFVLGITKAYTTRVGAGPFPTELLEGDKDGDTMCDLGREFGTTTGRKRRCGWFDAVQIRQTVKTCGIHGMALMKLDVLDTLAELKICTGYELDGKTYDYLPAAAAKQAKLTPIYETMPGWQQPLRGIQKLADLPPQALAYIKRLETLTGIPAVVISTSPDRQDTILVHDFTAGEAPRQARTG